MRTSTTILLTSLALTAFAGNSILCRLALGHGSIDAASFTAIRVMSGAMMASFILLIGSKGTRRPKGSWLSSLALVAYAVFFSFAYVRLPAAVGALVLFGSVQVTMIGWDVVRGTRPHPREWAGLALALGGLIGLNAPGIQAPEPFASLEMALAGASWGVYSIRGRTSGDPLTSTAGNFVLGMAFLPLLFAVNGSFSNASVQGIWFAVASGGLTSGLGYAIWYRALKHLRATTAGIVQLLVPPVAALGGVVFLGESITVRLVICGGIILAGVLTSTSGKQKNQS